MTDLVVPFITGLTTGGLSCLAVQGGLLASSVASTAEKEIQQKLAARTAQGGQSNRQQKKHGKQSNRQAQPVMAAALPILIFLGAKLAAYTALGFLLGALGSVLQLSPFTRAVMQIAIGVFMLGTALNMLKVHAIFRYFVIEPPKAVTRFIRRISKNSADDVATPAFLGVLTVVIPCGVTQTMMALAIGSADPFSGAAIMFAFILGTSPLFFGLAYLARKLGQVMEARFMKFAAVAVIFLALLSIEGGLNLLGSPVSFTALGDVLLASSSRTAAVGGGSVADANNTITIDVAQTGYSPSRITAIAGRPARLNLVTDHSYGWTRAFTIPSLGIQKILPETGETLIELPTQPAGQLRFACGMGMYSGVIEFVEGGALAPVQPQSVKRLSDPAQEEPVAAAAPLACDPAIATCQPPGAMLRIVPAAAPETVTGPVLPAAVGAQPEASDGAQTINISLVNGAYTPARSRAKAGLPSKLLVHTQNGYGWALDFVIPSLGVEEILDETGIKEINLPPQPAGTLRFSCGMGMVRGQIVFE